ncbi:MAG: glycine--tRNA ligase [Candidatus Diapherotrites archaeon]|uniref:glycine--tRNA ligase n=1 Tax=Candidatus Iainarchaeum sp. TaxID=3101447 RepID=A0A8T3YQD5_9ARCH|nr:glycine--tRNA ligase [Candidatus Diapherotrites archaeon]
MAQKPEFADRLTAYLKEKGFVYGPEPEIYGGISGFYSYGPLGKRLKNNIEAVIRKHFNTQGFYEMEYPLVTPAVVWKASGHLDGFNDPVILTEDGKESYRADKLIEEMAGIQADHMKDEELLRTIKEKSIKAPTGKKLAQKIERHSLMMKTTIGLNTEAYNRPETATTTYLPFRNYLEFFRDKLPFGVFQIGKAFRNEISPRQHLVRCREFTQAESQTFLFPEMKRGWEKFAEVKNDRLPFWTEEMQKNGKEPQEESLARAMESNILKNKAYAWHLNLAYKMFLGFGIPKEKIRLRQHHSDEKAFYSDDTWDIEVNLKSFGWLEVCGISDRTNYDLQQHAKFSGQKLAARTAEGKEEVPHVIEIAFGVDRPFFALLDLVYDERQEDEQRTLLRIPARLAPVQAGVFPLVKKDGLAEKAMQIHKELQKKLLCVYDEGGSIGRRYSRQDAVGTPYCITIDYDTMKDGTVTLRERDTMKQERVKAADLEKILGAKADGND